MEMKKPNGMRVIACTKYPNGITEGNPCVMSVLMKAREDKKADPLVIRTFACKLPFWGSTKVVCESF